MTPPLAIGPVLLAAPACHLSAAQAGVLSRAQLATSGIGPSAVAAQLDGRRWQCWGPSVVVLHNGALTRAQLLHAAVLHIGPRGSLAAGTALEAVGFRGFPDERVHAVHPRATSVIPMPGLVVHESRRLSATDVAHRGTLSLTDGARSAIDMAAWQPWPRFAYTVVATVVQQRVTSGRRLAEALETVGQVRHVRHLRAAVRDIAAGAQTNGEIDLARVCRRHRIAEPHRQRIRKDAQGRRRYLDAEWDCSDGAVLVLEVDGQHHLDAAYWVADMKRERAFVCPGRRVLRCANLELRLDGDEVATDLIANAVPRH